MPLVHWLACLLAGWLTAWLSWPLCMLIYVRCSFILPSFKEHVTVFASFCAFFFFKAFGFHFVFVFIAVRLNEFTVAANGLQWTVCVCACWKSQRIEFPMTVLQRRQLNIHTLSILELRLKCKFIFKKSKLLHVYVSVLKSTPQTHTKR